MYPDHVTIGHTQFPLRYQFTPGEERDGVTITVPRHALNQISHDQLDWLVPGRLEEKITALIRTLPKSIRRCLVPAPETARQAAAQLPFGQGPFLPALAAVLGRISGETVRSDAFQLDRLPAHLQMKVHLIDDQGEMLAVDHCLDRLRDRFHSPADGPSGRIDDIQWNRPKTGCWDFGDLPGEIRILRGGLHVPAYPAILDDGDGVMVRLLDTADRACATRRGRECGGCTIWTSSRRVRHVGWLPRLADIRILAATWPGRAYLEEDLALLIADRAFVGEEPLPRDESAYRRRLATAAEARGGSGPRYCPFHPPPL